MAGIADVLYVRFRVADLAKQRDFITDFGFVVEEADGLLLARGTDPNPYVYIAEEGDPAFLGIGFEALSQQDLERIAAIDGAPIDDSRLPGGGVVAQLTDPDGFPVYLVHGIEKPAPVTPPARQRFNSGTERKRLGERVSLEPSQPIVKRLGHCVLWVTDFRTSEAWYKQRLGLITSDEVYDDEETNTIGAFMRCNRGEQYVDHHTLFLVNYGEPAFHHAAFEVADWDTLMLGHDHLTKQGYEHFWGIGKHLLGSQVFDYWKDPAGFTVEHFTDGDMFNEASGSHMAEYEKLLAVHWGPEAAPHVSE
jgi:catechol 2,3-dioxygenase-like lactoylglutathione lyase family enzyme